MINANFQHMQILKTFGMMIVENSESLEIGIGSPCWSPVDEAVMMEMIVDLGPSCCKVNICNSSLFINKSRLFVIRYQTNDHTRHMLQMLFSLYFANSEVTLA